MFKSQIIDKQYLATQINRLSGKKHPEKLVMNSIVGTENANKWCETLAFEGF